MDSLPAPDFSESFFRELLNGYQSQVALMAEEVMRLKEKRSQMREAEGEEQEKKGQIYVE